MKVAIYDSGVGGLSILRALADRMPQSQYIFVSDNAGYPYGTKSEDELLNRCQKVADRIVTRYQPDVLIIACNTASTVCLPVLRSNHQLPIVGVVPAIKPAALASKSKVIGLLATPATISRSYTEGLIDEFAHDCVVIKVGSSDLVDLAEKKLKGLSVNLNQLETILTPFLLHESLDTLVLACTHFPLLTNEIEAVLSRHGKSIMLIDSADAIAKRVESLFSSYASPVSSSHEGYLLTSFSEGQHLHNNLAVFTEEIGEQGLIGNLKNYELRRIETLSI